ncbi:MAG: hypothetical protein K0R93_1491 [Anaerosolibacter sp.]|uniref:flagellar protein FlaG n=1 Tax=Anaerosolibacter sp. TaxID=1872527 RepID=UPI002639CF91|nr:flagellar protein FlaG [Anaerosolibacter sp.]MDF2546593.1 hypothetical protein [Anaerosolibacter sp.]
MKVEGLGMQTMAVGTGNTVQTESRPINVKAEGKADVQKFPGEKQLIDAIEKSNDEFIMENTSLKFSIHEKTKQIQVKIINNTTNEVVREIPAEKILDMVAAMLERTGIFMDKRG